MQFNEYQSSLEELNIESYPQEVQEQFFDFINNVPYIKSLIAEDRPKAKDLPKDNEGKIIIDITKPHILEDMDYFRPTAIHFQQYGCVTKLRPNPNPNSEFGKWIREEIRRCHEGYIRESDGEWITGDMYFFLNYCPIQLTKKDKKGKTIRVIDFPRVWEGHYYVFHYLYKARNEGKHAAELASRGKGKAHPYYTKVLTSTGWKQWKDVTVGDYIWGDDGNLTKVIDIPFNDICPMYKITLADGRTVECSEGHLWNVYSHFHKGELKTFSTKYLYDTYKSSRKITQKNPKGIEYQYSVPANKGVDYPFKETKVDPYTFGLLLGGGCFRIDGINKTYYTCHNSDWEHIKEFIPYKNVTKYNNTKYGYNLNIPDFINTLKGYGLFMCKSEDKFIPEEYLYNSRKIRLELLKGILDSDGTTSNGRYDIDLSSKIMRDQLIELCSSLGYNYRTSERDTGYYKNGEYKQCKTSYRLRIYTKDILCKLPRKIKNIEGRSNSNYANSKIKGTKIVNIEYIGEKLGKCVTVDNKSHCYLIGDYITTHNSYLGASLLAKRFILGESEAVNKKVQCVVTASERKYIQGANQILDMFVYYINFCGQHTEWPSKKLTESLQNLQWTMGYQDLDTGTRRGTENAVTGITSKDDESKLRGTRGVLYLIEEMGTFPRLLNLYSVLRPSVEDGNDVWGTIFVYGTAGDSDSDFAGAQELMYNPQGYNMLAIPNVYDKEGQGRKYFTLFFGGYLNRAECYNDNGVSNVTKALLEILADRYKVKYNSTDINAITKRIAEIPITPQEAILRTKGNIFPVTALNERLNQLDNNPNEYSDVYVGTLEFSNNKVEFRPTNDIPIREFPTKDNKVEGAIEIFEMPQEVHGNIPQERYIMSLDNYENDTSNTMSLGSMFVLDLWTDRIVAEYTGRPMFADDLNEIARKMALFYNARIMYEAHPYSQEVNTPNGKMLWKDVNIGTKLFAPNNKIVEVIDVPVNEYMPIYKVTLQDDRIVYASDNHIWNVEKLGYNRGTINLTTKQMMDLGTRNKHKQHIFYIINNNKVEYEHKNVPIDPYTLGLLLAEGCFTKKHCRKNSIQVSSNEEDMMFYSSIIPYNIYDKHYGYNWRFIIENCKDIMTDLGLYNITSHNKFIPKEYLYNSYNVRLELLKGLMDGDGCASTKGARALITASKYLAEDVCSLCRSLGMNCKYTYNTVIQAGKIFNHYRISIYTEETIFKLPRKVNQEHKYNSKAKGSKANAFLNKIAIETIEFSHYEMGKCVTVNSKDGLYLIGDYVVTHNCNKKNTFAYFSKMNCVYLLADAPEYLRQKQLIKTIGYGNTSKGINASAPIKNYGFTLIRDWLLKPVTTIIKQDGEEVESTVPNLHFLRNRALIKELILFNPDINVDRIMSLVQLMLYREEKMILYQGDVSKSKDRTPADYKGNDDFFSKNYDNKRKSVNLGAEFFKSNLLNN